MCLFRKSRERKERKELERIASDVTKYLKPYFDSVTEQQFKTRLEHCSERPSLPKSGGKEVRFVKFETFGGEKE